MKRLIRRIIAAFAVGFSLREMTDNFSWPLAILSLLLIIILVICVIDDIRDVNRETKRKEQEIIDKVWGQEEQL